MCDYTGLHNTFVEQEKCMVSGHVMGSDAVSLNTILEYVDKLDLDDQQYLQEILHRRLIDAKRADLVFSAKQARGNIRKNQCKSGSAHDLLVDLNG